MGMAPLRRDGEGPGAASDVEQTNRRTESGSIEQRALDDSLAGGQPDDRVVRGRERLEPQGRDERRILCASPRRCVCRRGLVHGDRKSVVEGKSVSGRVDLGGRRIIKKKNKKIDR